MLDVPVFLLTVLFVSLIKFSIDYRMAQGMTDRACTPISGYQEGTWQFFSVMACHRVNISGMQRLQVKQDYQSLKMILDKYIPFLIHVGCHSYSTRFFYYNFFLVINFV